MRSSTMLKTSKGVSLTLRIAAANLAISKDRMITNKYAVVIFSTLKKHLVKVFQRFLEMD